MDINLKSKEPDPIGQSYLDFDWILSHCAFPSRQQMVDGALHAPQEVRHQLFVEDRGNVDGIPVVLVHGGPGSPIAAHGYDFLDRSLFRIIQIHQRGSGASLPSGELSANSTKHLRDDIELVRQCLGIPSWHVFGWSWGATLAANYADAYAGSVRSLTAFGIFLGTEREHQSYLSNLSENSPDRYQAMCRIWQPELDLSPLNHFAKFLDEQSYSLSERRDAVRAWFERQEDSQVSDGDYHRFRVNVHYGQQHYFLEERWWERLSLPLSLPVTLLHGQSDLDVPLESAKTLSAAISQSQLEVINGGHDLYAPDVQARLAEIFRMKAEREYQQEFRALFT